MLSKNKWLIAAILWSLLVTFLSLISLGNLNLISSAIKFEHKDKIVHFTFYCVFMLLWLQYISKANINFSKYILLIFSIGYGILMEVIQGVFTNYRTADVFDIFANSLGAISGLIGYRIFKKE